ncbi:MAG TPA: Fic family protein, partial [Candidatus Saccharimonadales bacterium]|nr:Fic family protein [Candidatus Saccharimonadales bacterium]
FPMARKHEAISTKLTENLHHLLMEGIEQKDLGKFRDGPVFVGHKTKLEIVVKHNPPFHTRAEIEKALEDLYGWISKEDDTHPFLKAGIMHHQFAYIHPFFDGNGRLARILTAYYLLLKHYEVTKFFILDDYYDIDRQLYSDTLHTADTGDKTEWLEYFLEGIGYSLQAALARIKELQGSSLDSVTGEKRVLVTNREEEVLQIILDRKAIKTQDIVEDLEVTRQQAHALLASLVKKGLLEKFGKTKTSYYKLLNNTSQ